MKNFYMWGLWQPVEPFVIRMSKPEQAYYLSIQTTKEEVIALNEYVKKEWKKLYPDRMYRGRMQDELYAETKTVNNNVRLMFLCLSIVAMVMSVSGLFTMVSLNIIKKLKELGVRKVLGASLVNISNNINREFYIILTIAAILGSVGAFFIVDLLLSSIYTYYVDMNAVAFILSALILFFSSLITISTKVFKAASASPVNALRER